MVHARRLVALAIVIAVSSGCATPLKVDVTPTAVGNSTVATDTKISSIKIDNRAGDAKLINEMFDDSFIPIRTDPPTKKTVEADIERILRNVVTIDAASSTILLVRLQRAEAYWTLGVVDSIPFIGIATAGTDRDFLMNVSFQIEVEQQGKVKNTYMFDEKVVIRGSAAFPSNIKESYETLIRESRLVLQRALQSDFAIRYL